MKSDRVQPMLIENEVLNFAPSFKADKIKLSDLQMQYLNLLQGQDTIQQVVQRLYQNGWLVNFEELYQLIKYLVVNNFVVNPNFHLYFSSKLEQIKPISSGSSAPTTFQPAANNPLLQLPFFRLLPKDFSEALLKQAKVYKLPANYSVCKAGDNTRDLFVLLSGQAAIFKNKQFISLINKNSVFGEAGFLLGQPRTADIMTTEQSDVLVVPYQKSLLDPLIHSDKASAVLERFWIQQSLASSAFFKNIPTDCLDALVFAGKIISLKKDQILFNQGDLSQSAYLVIQGSVQVYQNQKLINTMAQGHFFGEVSLIATVGQRSATVLCPNSALLMEITREKFYQILSQNLFLAKDIQNLAFERLKKDQTKN